VTENAKPLQQIYASRKINELLSKIGGVGRMPGNYSPLAEDVITFSINHGIVEALTSLIIVTEEDADGECPACDHPRPQQAGDPPTSYPAKRATSPPPTYAPFPYSDKPGPLFLFNPPMRAAIREYVNERMKR
jgi:hypothetical protein